ncbi:hypothetical protein [Streptomyces sp. NBC_00212]|uniref:hypothetical protein n=1 Tax=Streptomyces sp. NBC_00212 TaxID=2975684 RepID=UPI00324EAEDE
MHVVADDEREISTWLAGTLNIPEQAYVEWQQGHIALLALGRRFSAVRLSQDLVQAVAESAHHEVVSAVMKEALRGPLIHDPQGRHYYALVRPSEPPADLGPHAKYLGLGSYIGVPRVGDDEPAEYGFSY